MLRNHVLRLGSGSRGTPLELFHDLVVGRGLVPVDALAAKRLVPVLFVARAVARCLGQTLTTFRTSYLNISSTTTPPQKMRRLERSQGVRVF